MADLSKSQQDTQKEKEMAGRAAAELVRDGDVVGLGTGSTAYFAVLALGERVKAGLKIVGIPTSNATAELAKKVGVPLTSIDQHPAIDIDIDGADEIDPHLNLIKAEAGRCCARRSWRRRRRRWSLSATPASWCRCSANFRCRWK